MVEKAVAILVVIGLGVLPIVGLAIQVWRDWRGRRRNVEKRCYSCGGATFLLPVHHYKGDTFMYCPICLKRGERLSQSVALVGGGIICFGFIVWLAIRS